MLIHTRGLAVLLVVACAAMMGFALASLVLPGTEHLPERPSLPDFLMFSAIILAYPAVGSIVAWKRPFNPVGWLFLAVGVAMTLAVFATEYPGRVAYAGARLPGAEVVAWLGEFAWILGPSVALPLAVILFPDGRPPALRWRVLSVVATAGACLVVVAAALVPGPLTGYGGVFSNPVAAPGLAGEAARFIRDDALILVVLPGLVAVLATANRFRLSAGVERQQLKWLLYPIGLVAAGLFSAIITQLPVAWTASLAAMGSVPVAAGIAILRYRLYDIDVVIRRTLVYGLVVGFLAVVYVALVLVLQASLRPVTGGDMLPVALSTLAIAALFGPVRGRVRKLVDRRFYRSRYDAQRTLEAFSARLRGEVELEAVAGALVGVTRQAVSPRSSAVWVRSRAAR